MAKFAALLQITNLKQSLSKDFAFSIICVLLEHIFLGRTIFPGKIPFYANVKKQLKNNVKIIPRTPDGGKFKHKNRLAQF